MVITRLEHNDEFADNNDYTMITFEENNLVNEESTRKNSLFYKAIVILAMISVMGGLLTGVMTYMNVGDSENFMTSWRNALLSAYAVMPVGIILIGLITKFINKIMPNSGVHQRNFIIGGLMAVIMESLLAFSTSLNLNGFSNHSALFTGWLEGFLAALPLGLTLVIIISMTIKPKIERFLKS